MTTKTSISLPDSTYERAVELARASGTTMSRLVNEALLAELARRHVAMLAEAEDPERLAERARSRAAALAAWKHAG